MSLPDISDKELNKLTHNALSSVFETMLGSDVHFKSAADYSGQKAPFPDLGGAEKNMIFVGSVGFVGSVNGVIYLYMKSNFAESAAQSITGLDDEDVDFEIVSDVCGEMTNVFAGGFKNTLADLGYNSVLTIPTVLSGDELYISTLGVVKHLRHNFVSRGEEIVADLVLAEKS
ncbi:chemotaxis protein CheX [Pelagicoccus sp. SDUM812002]|uniref:chemotaxis protein CheX n=1 Tax=Pelagicoccus sp. SDUM812002 TaxID=3041266 RepID=UPI00280CF072|nr:chemotaxis protein CheX [Pelagicoccus sp. SDUM812002]MDQ8185554.1 chemotaxis protein CheX [Pelagicoccus sp. SDUM812002]